MMRDRKWRYTSYGLLVLLALGLMVLGLTVGFLKIHPKEVLAVLLGGGDEVARFTVLEIRLPRLIITFFMGMALAISGSVLQTLTRNPLADPGIIGVNAGAGLGVTVAYLIFDFSAGNVVYMLPLIGFIGALAAFSMNLWFSYEKGRGVNMDKLVLVGIGSAIAISGTMILFISSVGREDVLFIQRWLSGNIWGDTWQFVWVTVPILTVLMVLVFMKADGMNILAMDDLTAQSLGMALGKERLQLILLAVALAAVAVATSGAIAFVGLIIPHMAKKIYGPKHQHFMIGSLLLGGIFLMGADLLGRNILLPQGLLAGIVVALIGAPYFLWLVVKSNH